MMSRKNIIIFILLSSFSMMKLSAQEGRRFEPQVKFSYEKGVNKMKPSTYSVEFIAGLRTSEQTRIGIGIGYAGNSHLFKDYSYYGSGLPAQWSGSSYSSKKDKYKNVGSMPLFLTVKHNICKPRKISPYIGMDVGYSHYSSAKPDNSSVGGFFLRPQVGVDIRTYQTRISFELSFKHTKLSDSEMVVGWFSQVGIALGLSVTL